MILTDRSSERRLGAQIAGRSCNSMPNASSKLLGAERELEAFRRRTRARSFCRRTSSRSYMPPPTGEKASVLFGAFYLERSIWSVLFGAFYLERSIWSETRARRQYTVDTIIYCANIAWSVAVRSRTIIVSHTAQHYCNSPPVRYTYILSRHTGATR